MKKSHIHAGGDATPLLDTELIDRVEILGDNFLLIKCVNDHKRDENGNILVAHTDEYIDTTLWCEILKVGKGCKLIRQSDIGGFMHIPEWEGRGWNKIGPNIFVMSEKLMDKKNPVLLPVIYTKD